MESTVAGLDFGTTTTLVAATGGVVPLGEGTGWMTSLVGYDDEGGLVAGLADDAGFPGRTVRSVKRCITAGDQYVQVSLDDGTHEVSADSLMAEVLREATRRGHSRTHGDLDLARPGGTRLGCPAMWDGRQRRRLLGIAEAAGIRVSLADLVDEPVAAGIAWLARRRRPERDTPLRVLVFDMGGGTLGVAVLDVRGSGGRDVSVLAAVGSSVGGDALDTAITADLEKLLELDLKALPDPAPARWRLAAEARKAKLFLTDNTEYPVALPARIFGRHDVTYTRARLEAAFQPLMAKAEETVIAALRTARLTELEQGAAQESRRVPLDRLLAGVDVVVLSGGMAHVPYVATRLRELFAPARDHAGAAPIVVEPAVEPAGRTDGQLGPESAVALGLARSREYGRINMFRPALDIYLEWRSGRRRRESRLVYQAYTPVVAPWPAFVGGADLKYVRNGVDLGLPRSGTGALRVVSHTGAEPRSTLGNRGLDGFPVALHDERFEFSLYPNGRLRMVDRAGEHEGRLDDWHVVGVR